MDGMSNEIIFIYEDSLKEDIETHIMEKLLYVWIRKFVLKFIIICYICTGASLNSEKSKKSF